MKTRMFVRMNRRVVTAILTACIGLAATPASRAATWDGDGAPPDGDGLWTTAANWNPDGVPAGVSADINLNNADVLLNDGSTQTIAGMQLANPANITASLSVNSGSVINVNGGFSMATGNTSSNATLTLNNATLNGISGGEWVRRGGTANISMTDSTVNFTAGAAWAGANAGEGDDLINLDMVNSTVNITAGGLGIGWNRNDQRVLFNTFDSTSEINITNGGIVLNGGNPSGPGGHAVYELPLAAAANTPGKIFANNGVSLGTATGGNPKVTLTLDAAGTLGVPQSDPVLNWNGSALTIATGGPALTEGTVNLTGITINNMGGSEWARRGSTATVNMTDSTINSSSGQAWAGGNAGEGADTLNLNMTNSKINLSAGGISIANNHANQKALISLDGTSQINLSAGGISIAGGDTSFAGDVDTPAGTAVYTLPLAAAPNTNGKIYAHNGIFSVGQQSLAKTEVNITSSGPNASDASLDWHGAGLGIAGGGPGGLGRVLIDDVDISGVGGFTITRRTNSNGLLSIKDATFGTSGVTIGFGEGTGEQAQLVLDNATFNSTGQIINRNQANASTEVRGNGLINVTSSSFRQDGRVVADGGDLTITASGGVASNNLGIAQTHFGQAGLYATDGSGASRLTLPGIAFANNDRTWGEDVGDSTPDYVNSVFFDIGTTAAGTLAGSLLATDHSSNPAGLVNAIGVWDFSGITFDSATLLIRYDDLHSNLGSIVGGEAALKLFQNSGSGWFDITASVDTGANTILSDPITGLSFFAVAENAINAAGTPEPTSAVLAVLGLVGLLVGRRRRSRV